MKDMYPLYEIERTLRDIEEIMYRTWTQFNGDYGEYLRAIFHPQNVPRDTVGAKVQALSKIMLEPDKP
jgi:hypothetical protein